MFERTNSSGRLSPWLALLALAFGFAALAFAIIPQVKKTPKEDRVYIDAVISRINTYEDSDGDKHSRAVVSYTVDGKEYEIVLRTFRMGYHVGKQIKIYYDKDDPSHIGVDGENIFSSAFLLMFGLVFTSCGVSLLAKSTVGAWFSSLLARSGTKVDAEYAGVRYIREIGINGREPCVIQAKAFDPETMQQRVFSSEWFMTDPDALIRQAGITSFPVYINPRNPKRYYMDVSAVKKLMKN